MSTAASDVGALFSPFPSGLGGLRKGIAMSHFNYGVRRPRPSFAALSALDFGLRVRIEARPRQMTIFSGAHNLSVQELTAELVMRQWILPLVFRGFRSDFDRGLMTGCRVLGDELRFAWAKGDRACSRAHFAVVRVGQRTRLDAYAALGTRNGMLRSSSRKATSNSGSTSVNPAKPRGGPAVAPNPARSAA
jgi:hypothetical protein